jgi:hypothetical protein
MNRYSLHELLEEYVQRKWDSSREKRMEELRQLKKWQAPLVYLGEYPSLTPLGHWLSAGSRRWLMMCWEERTCL